ncbi:hypothetical protein ACIGZJ_32910 [Kitasatospora sp. NPDC052868]|uniref:hypothetical protein n=1 Tax=Kitasatospora sp. NPDC052868 TaxID=3364060 RepID=UPI0037C924A7
MTTPTISTPTVSIPAAVLRAVLQVYPARYRRERGDELAAVFFDTTAEAGRPAILREMLDLAAYGLRVRTGVTAFSTRGRVLALAAPLIAGALAGLGLFPWVTDSEGIARRLEGSSSSLLHLTIFAQPVATMLLAVAALLGRWTAARVLSVAVMAVGLLGMADAFRPEQFSWWWVSYTGASQLPLLLSGLLVIAAPRELLSEPGLRTRVLVLASAVGGGLVVAAQGGYDTHFLMNGPWSSVLLLLPAVLLLAVVRGWLVPAAIGLAVLPLTLGFSLFSLWEEVGGMWYLLPLLGAVAVAMMAVALVAGRGVRGTRSVA